MIIFSLRQLDGFSLFLWERVVELLSPVFWFPSNSPAVCYASFMFMPLLQHWPCFCSWMPQDSCTSWSLSLEWVLICLCQLLTLTHPSDQLLREAASGTLPRYVPLVICSLGTMYLSFMTLITGTTLYCFVWFSDWCLSPPPDSDLHSKGSCLRCGPSLYSKHFLQCLAKTRCSIDIH